jgi:hypothetical protein
MTITLRQLKTAIAVFINERKEIINKSTEMKPLFETELKANIDELIELLQAQKKTIEGGNK